MSMLPARSEGRRKGLRVEARIRSHSAAPFKVDERRALRRSEDRGILDQALVPRRVTAPAIGG